MKILDFELTKQEKKFCLDIYSDENRVNDYNLELLSFLYLLNRKKCDKSQIIIEKLKNQVDSLKDILNEVKKNSLVNNASAYKLNKTQLEKVIIYLTLQFMSVKKDIMIEFKTDDNHHYFIVSQYYKENNQYKYVEVTSRSQKDFNAFIDSLHYLNFKIMPFIK